MIIPYSTTDELKAIMTRLAEAGIAGIRVYVDRVEIVSRWDRERLSGWREE